MSNKNKHQHGEVRTTQVDQSDTAALDSLPETPITEEQQVSTPVLASTPAPAAAPAVASSPMKVSTTKDWQVTEGLFNKEKIFMLQINSKQEHLTTYAQEYSGKRSINFRKFYLNDNDELSPGKGVSFTVDQWEQMLPKIQQIVAEEKARTATK